LIRRATGRLLGATGIGRYDDTSYETLRVGRDRSRSREPLRSRDPSREPWKEQNSEKPAVTEPEARAEARYEPYRHHESA
jgi:hypothetical protein